MVGDTGPLHLLPDSTISLFFFYSTSFYTKSVIVRALDCKQQGLSLMNLSRKGFSEGILESMEYLPSWRARLEQRQGPRGAGNPKSQ